MPNIFSYRLFAIVTFLVTGFAILFVNLTPAHAQVCTNNSRLDWDHVDYFAGETLQRFAAGTVGVEISVSGNANAGYPDDDQNNYSDTGAHFTGADLEFLSGAGSSTTITITFTEEVDDLRFSLHDIDQRDRVTVSGENDFGSAVVFGHSHSVFIPSYSPGANGVTTSATLVGNGTTQPPQQTKDSPILGSQHQ
ncbi:hypothetical protein N9K16_04550 [Alphaproteobacteria bacterium]|nr:hypothetical protein [Alphaproteobacteria bacterium]